MKSTRFFICALAITGFAWGCSDDSSSNSNNPSEPENTAERCADGQDNDNNGKTDCEEDSCKAFDNCKKCREDNKPADDCICESVGWVCPNSCGNMPEGMNCDCVDGTWKNCTKIEEKTEICDNDTDDDEDGKTDCDDEDCAAHDHCNITITPCEEGTSSCEGKTRNYCEGGVLKMEECAFECIDGVCKSCNDINGPDTCEEKDGIFVHAYCSDEGRKTEGCLYGCEDDHCIACIEGSQQCSEDGKSLETCTVADNKTQWVATPCSGTCEDNRCTGCAAANTQTCKDGILEICDSNKQYSSETCEFGCKDDSSCHTCSEGMLSCDTDGKTILVCKNDEMTFYNQCANACKNASCEDENGNHMKDEFDGDWQKAASCKKHSDCSTKFCDPMVNGGTCMNKCVHNTQCVDGYVCRPDGRCAPEEFITVWQTTQPDEKISFILAGGEGCNVKVDWGDGTVETITGNYCINRASSHTYKTAGEHRVKMSEGKAYGFGMWTGYESKLIRIESFGPADFAGYAFKNTVNLKSISKVDIPDASKLTNMTGMFYNSTQFNDEMILKWDVSNVKNMKDTFAYTKKFNQDLSKWDTSNITNMSGMFQYTEVFNQPIGQWNTSKVTNMSGMFHNAKVFNQPIGQWNTAKVTDMYAMFSDARAFNQPIQDWNVKNVTNMSYMFNNTMFNKPIDNWDVSNVTDMSYMFANNTVFSQKLDNWNVSKVTNMSHMFSGTSRFNSDISNWIVRNVTDMSYMFYRALVFNQPISGWNVSEVTDMQYMFAYTQQFNWYLSAWNVQNVTNMKGMFEGAQKFNNNGGGTDYYTSSLGVWNVSKVTDMSHMFEGSPCNQDISDWDVSNVTDMSRMFYNDKAFNQPLKDWKKKTANVKDMHEMFYGATAFNQDVSTWGVGNVQNMSRMFYNATSYNETSNNWRPTYITNSKDCTRLSEMFYHTKLSCSEARSMISNWGLKGVCTANQLRGSTDCD